jgi:acyl transferase domain-containing protein/NAD(P)H-dependent flavin oxidoreductase YrpB (nitropropane dioxygenase family)
MTDDDFKVLCMDRLNAAGAAAVATAAARAGAVGVVDLELSSGAWTPAALDELLASEGAIGLRVYAPRIAAHVCTLARFAMRAHSLIVSLPRHATDRELAAALNELPRCAARTVLLEIIDSKQARLPTAQRVDAFIAKGNEAGGRIGESSTFVLVQELLAAAVRPVFAQGGLGIRGAAACRAVGCAGVVLDEQLLLSSEARLSHQHAHALERLTGKETVVLTASDGEMWRVLPRRARGARTAPAVTHPRANDSSTTSDAQHAPTISFAGAAAWPVGQAVGFAAALRDKHRTTGRIVRAFITETERLIGVARSAPPLAPNAPLAASHGTRFPIAQGPMTRVSDTPAFAEAVACGGALPFLALALMRKEQVSQLLRATAGRLGARPWGVGILGFVPQALREEQIDAIRSFKPHYALIAGGRPDQARVLEAAGVPTYLHVPSPHLLEMFLEEGARRFVFEGRECGGHVGPFASLVLWEHVIATLLAFRAHTKDDVHVLFAGGIHDARSAAMVSVMSGELAQQGVNVGVLMGTAYLFTAEAVASGAIVPGFQSAALACEETVLLETGTGHLTRCAASPFVTEFLRARAEMIAQGKSAELMREELEALNIGRLRIASKGLARDSAGALNELDADAQRLAGMYMLGQVATRRSAVTTIEALHREVSLGGTALLERSPAPQAAAEEVSGAPADVAIIGIATLLPHAHSPEAYWRNIVTKHCAIGEVPRERWDWRLYYDPDRRARDRIYSKWGGFIGEVPFDPMRFGIPPNSLKSIDPMQLLALEAVRRALDDAGYADGGADREHTTVILGAGGGLGDVGLQYGVRSELPRVNETNSERAWERLPEWTEESFPGSLLNVAAGRIASRYDIGGSNFVVDAACASSLAAVDLAVRELESGRSKLAIAGGVDTLQGPFAYLCFSKTQALSPRGQARTFDKNADGIVISEGVAIVVLKRLVDAQRDGDKVYAVIKAVGSSSDGKALGLTAPLPKGQMRALHRAYARAGFSPATLGLIEAHGTGTPVGDRAETDTIVQTLRAHSAGARSCAVGSVKTLIGHTKATAGAAALVKAALALYHRTLPPHVGADDPIEPLAAADCPAYLLKEARPWFRSRMHPRRAGVSAFGFGGTNFHAVLEEAPRSVGAAPPRIEWPCELVVVRAESSASLEQELARLHAALSAGWTPPLADLAYSTAMTLQRVPLAEARSFAAVVDSLPELMQALTSAIAQLRGEPDKAMPPNAFVQQDAPPGRGKLAFLFPGQGSQYPDMLREALVYLPALRNAVEAADDVLRSCYPQPLSSFIYPPGTTSPDEAAQARARLTDTHVAQPAIGALEAGCIELAHTLGIHADMAAGHSYGEYAALYAGGALSLETFLALSETRGRLLAERCTEPEAGAMAAVPMERVQLQESLNQFPTLTLANHNAPRQCVVSGPRSDLEAFAAFFQQQDCSVQMLPVAGAFHSALMAQANAPLSAAIEAVEFLSPSIPVYSNVSGEPHGHDSDAIREALTRHLLNPVEFVTTIEAMYRGGARLFVEMGPGSVLSRLVGRILDGRPHQVLALDQRGSLRGVLSAFAAMTVAGWELRAEALFEGRDVQPLDLTQRSPAAAERASRYFVSGGYTRTAEESVGRSGKLPFIDADTRAAQSTPLMQPASASHAQRDARIDNEAATTGANTSVFDPSLSDALTEHHKVMQHFLTVQEAVMTQLLGRASTEAPHVSEPPLARDTRHVEPPTSGANAVQHELAATSVTAPQTAATSDSAREPLRELLLGVVSERTGYPREMLKMDQDVEAELGIDSIKRIEIIGALQRIAPAAVATAIKADMDALTRAKTLDAILARITDESSEASGAEATPAVSGDEEAGEALPERLAEVLLAVVCERTGYPREMLGMDQDVEAELGIDSVKRVEILGAMRRRAPQISALISARMEQLTAVKTLNGLIAALTAPEAIDSARSVVVDVARSEAPRSGAPELECPPRYAIARIPCEMRTRAAIAGSYVIVADRIGVAEQLARLLQARGAEIRVIRPEDDLGIMLKDLIATGQSLAGLLHLSGLMPGSIHEEMSELEAWRREWRGIVLELFDLLKRCAPQLQAHGDATIISAALVLDDEQVHPAAAGAMGLIKTFAREYAGVRTVALELDAQLPPVMIAEKIVNELECRDRELHIGYSAAGDRHVLKTVERPLRAAAAEERRFVDAHSVVLLTGGARGITAEMACEFAQLGARLVVVGASELEEGEESAHTAHLEDPADLRKALIQALQQDGVPLAPMRVERALTALQKQREIKRNLERLRSYGVEVQYRAADLRDEAACAELMRWIYARYGRLDGVVHGAGVIEDRLIRDKDDAQFERVFSTKADSSFLLAKYVDARALSFFVFFTSVAGRYGNRGQADYAATNEAVAALARGLARRWPRTRVVAVNWGPWTNRGMASAGVLEAFRARGLKPIEPEAGRRFLMEELARGDRADVDLIVGEGPWEALEGTALDAVPVSAELKASTVELPFVRSKPKARADSSVEIEHSFSLHGDPYLQDHLLDQAPVLPLAAIAEWLAEVVQAAWLEWRVAELSNVCLLKGVVLEGRKPRAVRFVARASSHADADGLTVGIIAYDAERNLPCYSASAHLKPALDAAQRIAYAPIDAVSSGIDAHTAYRDYLFHGRRLRLLTAIDAIDAAGVDARVNATEPALWLDSGTVSADLNRPPRGEWLFDPGLIDVAAQLAIVWSRATRQTTALPSRFGRITRFAASSREPIVRAVWRIREEPSVDIIRYDASFVSSAGAVLLSIEDAESVCSVALNRLAVQHS